MSSTSTGRTWRTTLPPPLQQLEDRRQRADRDAARAAGRDDAGAQRARRRRDRDRDLVGLGLVEDPRRVSSVRPRTAHAVDAHAVLGRVVVDEADRAEPEVRVAQDLAQDEAAAVAGADDQHAARVRRARKPLSGRS